MSKFDANFSDIFGILGSEVDGRIMSEIYFWRKIGYEDLRERRS